MSHRHRCYECAKRAVCSNLCHNNIIFCYLISYYYQILWCSCMQDQTFVFFDLISCDFPRQNLNFSVISFTVNYCMYSIHSNEWLKLAGQNNKTVTYYECKYSSHTCSRASGLNKLSPHPPRNCIIRPAARPTPHILTYPGPQPGPHRTGLARSPHRPRNK